MNFGVSSPVPGIKSNCTSKYPRVLGVNLELITKYAKVIRFLRSARDWTWKISASFIWTSNYFSCVKPIL